MNKKLTPQQEIGKKGEEIARQHLIMQGYEILETNWYFHHHELDIIAREGDELVIVEVKARTSSSYEHPSDAVTDRKIRFLVNAAEAYIQQHDSDLDTRFDVISIVFFGDNFNLEHIKDAFYPTA